MPHALHDLSLRLWSLQPKPGATKRDFLSLHDLANWELEGLLDLAREVKAFPAPFRHALEGKTVAMIFEKPSLRTRVTFEVSMAQMGGHAVYLSPADIALGKREAVKDVARNLARWVDGIVIRTFGHHILTEMAGEAQVPIVNALSDLLHPCQAVADVLTLREAKGKLRGLRLAFVGDGNNVAHALAQAAAKLGVHFTVACPRGYEPDATVFREACADAESTGASLRVVQDPAEAVHNADAVYTDVWASMGQEVEAEKRKKIFAPYQVNAALMAVAKSDAVFLHCLPAHRGEEVTDEVLDSPQSVVLEQAENRLHVAKAILLALMGEVKQPPGGRTPQ
jgi:ornithine carbamoyltransferase